MTRILADMPYIGAVLTVNHCYWGGRVLKIEARKWREVLAAMIRQSPERAELVPPLKVIVSGQFRDKRSTPDLHNIKLIADAVQMATGLNDQGYEMVFGEPEVGGYAPMIFVEIRDAKEVVDAP